MSTALSDDAGASYHRFRHNALTLGTISKSFNSLAVSMTAAYHAALTEPAQDAWTTLVMRTARLVERAHAIQGIVMLDAEERAALDFFEAIVRENADLLATPQPPVTMPAWSGETYATGVVDHGATKPSMPRGGRLLRT